MKILVGYTPTPEGVAAFDFADRPREAHRRPPDGAEHGQERRLLRPGVRHRPRTSTPWRPSSAKSGIEYEIRRPNDGLSATDSILGIAEEIGADLLVIGLRKRSAVGKLITGSTAQAVLLDSPCPVVAVKAKR